MIRNAALTLFDGHFVGAGPIERQHPARVSAAHRLLRGSQYGNKLREALGLPPIEKGKFKPGKKVARTA